MERSITQVYLALQKLIGLHRQLMDTVRLEREALISTEVKAIQDVTQAKHAVIEQISMAEQQRLKTVAELALIWKKPVRDLTLSNIVIAIQGEDPKGAEQLRSALNTLTILLHRISEMNRENQVVVERSLGLVNDMKKNVLGEASPRADTYGSKGQKSTTGGNSRLISKEA